MYVSSAKKRDNLTFIFYCSLFVLAFYDFDVNVILNPSLKDVDAQPQKPQLNRDASLTPPWGTVIIFLRHASPHSPHGTPPPPRPRGHIVPEGRNSGVHYVVQRLTEDSAWMQPIAWCPERKASPSRSMPRSRLGQKKCEDEHVTDLNRCQTCIPSKPWQNQTRQ